MKARKLKYRPAFPVAVIDLDGHILSNHRSIRTAQKQMKPQRTIIFPAHGEPQCRAGVWVCGCGRSHTYTHQTTGLPKWWDLIRAFLLAK